MEENTMKYFKWQNVSKNLFGRNSASVTPALELSGDSFTDLHLQAWSLLCNSCNRYQLERLSFLAWQYESGKRIP